MTRGQLWETFDQAAAEVGEVDLVETAWARGQVIRRRRQALTGAAVIGGVGGALAVAVAVLGGGTDGTLDQLPAGTPTHAVTPTTDVPDGANAGGVSVRTLAGRAGVVDSVDGRGPDARFGEIRDIAVGPSGTVYVSEASTIRKVTPDGAVATLATHDGPPISIQDISSGFHDLVVGPDETIYVVDGDTIRAVTSDGTISEVATVEASASDQGNDGSGTTDGTEPLFSAIRGITVDTAGTLYVADGGWVRAITPDGQVKTVGSCRLQGPDGAMCEQLAVAADGTIYFLNHGGQFPYVGTMTPDGHVSNLAVDDDRKQVRFGTRHYGFTLDPTDSSVYISDSTNDGGHALHKISRDGAVTTIDQGGRTEEDHGTLVDESGTPIISSNSRVGTLAIGDDGTLYAAVAGAILTIQGL